MRLPAATGTCGLPYHHGSGRELQGLRVARPSPPWAGGGPSPNLSPIAHPVAAAEATQETVESLMQKFKESFRANTPIEIGQLQPAPRRASAGKRKRRSKSRGRPSQHRLPRCQRAVPRFRRHQEELRPLPVLPWTPRVMPCCPRSAISAEACRQQTCASGWEPVSLSPCCLI